MSDCKSQPTSIGGQALIEGIMMRGPELSAMAVRLPDGSIGVESWPNSKNLKHIRKIPLVRGVFIFIDSLAIGYKCLMKSAEKAGMNEEEPSKFEKKLQEKLGDHFSSVFTFISLAISILLVVALFMVLPVMLTRLLSPYIGNRFWLTAIEGLIKIAIFVGYVAAVSAMPDIRRVFEYHGAEHKTIFCFEAGKELTVENIREFKRFHPRCGTSFLINVLILSIIVFSFVTWQNVVIRILLKFLLLPLVMSLSFEVNKLSGRYDNIITRIVAAPGLWLQRLTTREPDDSQLEIAIAAVRLVIPENREADKW